MKVSPDPTHHSSSFGAPPSSPPPRRHTLVRRVTLGDKMTEKKAPPAPHAEMKRISTRGIEDMDHMLYDKDVDTMSGRRIMVQEHSRISARARELQLNLESRSNDSVFHIILTVLQWVIGYALTLFMCVAAVVGVIGSLDHGTIGRQNFESGRLKDGLVHNETYRMTVIALVCFAINGVSLYHGILHQSYVEINIESQTVQGRRAKSKRLLTYSECYEIMSHVPLGAFVFGCISGGVVLLLHATGGNISFYLCDYVYIFFYVCLFGTYDITLQRTNILNLMDLVGGTIDMKTSTLQIAALKDEEVPTFLHKFALALTAFKPVAIMIAAIIIYSLTIVALFLYSGDIGKTLWLQILHNTMREWVMTNSRLEYIGMGTEQILSPIKRYTKMTVYEIYFALLTRIMLASFEDQTYTLFNVVLLSLIQGISRGTMQERDELYLKRDKALKRNLLLMTDEERDIFDEGHRKVIKSHILVSLISEFFSILMSCFLIALFSDNRMVFNLGYSKGESVDTAGLFLIKAYEAFTLLVSDAMVLVWHLKHGLNVSTLLNEIDHHTVFLGHITASIAATLAALMSFSSAPNFIYCTSMDPCSCYKFYVPLFEDYCGSIVNATTIVVDDPDDVEGKDSNAIDMMVFSLTGAAVLGFILIAGIFIMKLLQDREHEKQLEEMKKKLDMQLISDDKMDMVLNILGIDHSDTSSGLGKKKPGNHHSRVSVFLERVGKIKTISKGRASKSERSERSVNRKIEVLRAASTTGDGLGGEGKEDIEGEEIQRMTPMVEDDREEVTNGEEVGQESEGRGLTETEDEDYTHTDDEDEQEQLSLQEEEVLKPKAVQDAALDVIKSLQIPSSEIGIIDYSIAKGAFGEIHRGVYKEKPVAIKTLLTLDEESAVMFRHEIILSAQLQHPNIILLIGACWDKSLIALILEFADGGSLDVALKSNFADGNGTWTWHDPMIKIIIDIASAVCHLHNTRFYDDITKSQQDTILHRDLKPGNVLLTSSFAAKLSDFGTSKALDQSVEQTMVGTPLFMAPEIHMGENYGHAADVFSFGMLIWAMSVGHTSLLKRIMKKMRERPSKSEAVHSLMNAISHEEIRPSLKERCQRGMPKSLKDLIKKCWNPRKRMRPTMAQVLECLRNDVRKDLEIIFTRAQNNILLNVENDGNRE